MTENQRRPAPRRRRRVNKGRVIGCFGVLVLIIFLIGSMISSCSKKIKEKPKKPSETPKTTQVTEEIENKPDVTEEVPVIQTTPGNYIVCLDPGHGGDDPGSDYGNGARVEKTDDLKYAFAVKEAMEKYSNIDVYMTRETDKGLTNEERAEFSNSINADLHIALHRNMFQDSTAYGVEVWAKSAHDQIDDVFCFKVLSKLQEVGIQQNRGMKTGHPKNDDFELVKFTNANCITIELGYITNDEDNRLFDENYKEYAEKIAEAIAETCYEQVGPLKGKGQLQ